MFNNTNDFGFGDMFGNSNFQNNNQGFNNNGQSLGGNFQLKQNLNTIDDLVSLLSSNTPNMIQAIMGAAQRIQSNTTQGIYNTLGNALAQNQIGQHRPLLSALIFFINHEVSRGKNIYEIFDFCARMGMMYLGSSYGGNNDMQFKNGLNVNEAQAMPKFIKTSQDMVNVCQTLLKRGMAVTQQMDLNPGRNSQGIQGYLNQAQGQNNNVWGFDNNAGTTKTTSNSENPLLDILSQQDFNGSGMGANQGQNQNNGFGNNQQQTQESQIDGVADYYLSSSVPASSTQGNANFDNSADDYIIPGENYVVDTPEYDDGYYIPGEVDRRSKVDLLREKEAREQAQQQMPKEFDKTSLGQAIVKPAPAHGQTMSANGQYVPSREIQNPDLKRKVMERQMGIYTSGAGAALDENIHLDNYDDDELETITKLQLKFHQENKQKFGENWDGFKPSNGSAIDRANEAIQNDGVTWSDDGFTFDPFSDDFSDDFSDLDPAKNKQPATGVAELPSAPSFQHSPEKKEETKKKRVWVDQLSKNEMVKTLLQTRSRLKVMPVFNSVKQRLEVVDYGTFKIIRTVDEEDMLYENHILDDKINPLTGEAGSIEVAEFALNIANQPHSVANYKEEIKDLEEKEREDHSLFKDMANIEIEDVTLVSDSNEDYTTLPTQYIIGQLGNDILPNLDNCAIKYTQISHTRYVIDGDELEQLEHLMSLEDAADIAEKVQEFVTNNTVLPARVLAGMVQKFTNQVNNLLKIEIHPEYSVDNALVDAIDLSVAVLEDGYDDSKVNDIYRFALRTTFIPFTKKRMEALNVDNVDNVIAEDAALIGGLERILLLPYSHADLPIGVKGEFGLVTNEMSKALYSLLTSEFDNNEDVQIFKLITMDNVIYEFLRPTGGEEIVLKANQYTSE